MAGMAMTRYLAGIVIVAEAENGEEDGRQEPEPDPKACPLPEFFSKGDTRDDADDDLHTRDEEENKPPTRFPGDFEEYPHI